jgi:hypothetical protein
MATTSNEFKFHPVQLIVNCLKHYVMYLTCIGIALNMFKRLSNIVEGYYFIQFYKTFTRLNWFLKWW